jgi:hypothetical protein
MTTITTTTTTKNKRKRNAGRRNVFCPHASGVRDAPRRKAACAALRLRARSPAGVPLAVLASGTFVPKAQRRARLPEVGAKAAACRTRHFRSSDAPRAPVIVPAGMMPEPPGRGVYRSARGHRTRSAFRKYPPRRRPLKSEISRRYCHRGGEVKGI